VEVFFFAKGARNCSIVGAAFCRGLEELDIVRFIERLKKGVWGFALVVCAQELQIQAPASLAASLEEARGNWFILGGGYTLRNK